MLCLKCQFLDSPDKIGNKKEKYYATFGAKSVSGAAIYYMGIVDFLQDWTTRKKTERMLKIYLLGQEAEGTSVMHPDPYKVIRVSSKKKIEK